jgi:uncharacterized protein YdhG (YjbR/CyaY superfamily)
MTESTKNFTAEERAAMKARAKEAKANATKEKAAANQREKIAEFTGLDRELCERISEIAEKHAPDLDAKTFYGAPGWARDGKVVFFFQPAGLYTARYGTLGFQETATIDDGAIWPTSFAIIEWNAAVEKQVTALVKKVAAVA